MSRFEGPLENELRGEAAAALGVSARRLRRKLDLLRGSPAAAKQSEHQRERLIDDAAEALWGFVVQREILGMYDTEHVIRTYDVPPEVWKRLGVRKR
jgi:hypothetical protein